MRLNARRGSEQYHRRTRESRDRSVRWPLCEVRLLRTADFACSRSGRARSTLRCFLALVWSGLWHRRRLLGPSPSAWRRIPYIPNRCSSGTRGRPRPARRSMASRLTRRSRSSWIPDALDGPDLQHSSAESRVPPAWTGRRRTGAHGGVSAQEKWRCRSDPDHQRAAGEPRRAAAGVRRTRRRIDFSDIPDSSPEQLAVMRRVGRPPIGKEPRQLIAIRVDPSVLESFRKEARRRRVGYQTFINEVLAEHTRKDVGTFPATNDRRTAAPAAFCTRNGWQ